MFAPLSVTAINNLYNLNVTIALSFAPSSGGECAKYLNDIFIYNVVSFYAKHKVKIGSIGNDDMCSQYIEIFNIL